MVVKGRVGNTYGYNANMFTEMIRELLDDDEYGDMESLGRTPDEIRDLLRDLEGFRDGYRDVVHGERSIKTMNRPAWLISRNDAFRISLMVGERVKADPARRRQAALGQWIIDSGLTTEEALQKTLEMDPAEIESIIGRYGG